MKKILIFVTCLGIAVPPAGWGAKDKASQENRDIKSKESSSLLEIPKSVVMEETGDVLYLRGTAIYKLYFQDYYIAAYYSHRLTKNPQEALVDTGPKRMWLYFLNSTDHFNSTWKKAILLNNSPKMTDRMQLSVSQFLNMIDIPFHMGDTLILDYVPNIGTKILVKGSLKGIIKGNEFYNLMLKVWLGREPPSEKFRKDLFNLS